MPNQTKAKSFLLKYHWHFDNIRPWNSYVFSENTEGYSSSPPAGILTTEQSNAIAAMRPRRTAAMLRSRAKVCSKQYVVSIVGQTSCYQKDSRASSLPPWYQLISHIPSYYIVCIFRFAIFHIALSHLRIFSFIVQSKKLNEHFRLIKTWLHPSHYCLPIRLVSLFFSGR